MHSSIIWADMSIINNATPPPPPGDLRREILRQVTERGVEKSICPSEVARAYGENWQRLMSHVRNAARGLARDGLIEILRKGKPVDPETMKGVIRLRLRTTDPAEPAGLATVSGISEAE